MTLTIGNIAIGADNPCRFVAEISGNHNQSLRRAYRLIDAAKAAGADFVKFQCYLPSELVLLRGDGPAPEPWGSQGYRMGDLYLKARTPFEWFPELFQHARDVGLVPFSSVFGEASWRVLRAVDCPAYKVARLDNQSRFLITVAQMPGKPVIVSTSGERLLPMACPPIRLWCPKGYPQSAPFFERDTFTDDEMSATFDGFSYHGTSIEPPVVAATLGAKMIECHFQLRDEPSDLESNVSLDEHQFAEMIRRVRQMETMLA